MGFSQARVSYIVVRPPGRGTCFFFVVMQTRPRGGKIPWSSRGFKKIIYDALEKVSEAKRDCLRKTEHYPIQGRETAPVVSDAGPGPPTTPPHTCPPSLSLFLASPLLLPSTLSAARPTLTFPLPFSLFFDLGGACVNTAFFLQWPWAMFPCSPGLFPSTQPGRRGFSLDSSSPAPPRMAAGVPYPPNPPCANLFPCPDGRFASYPDPSCGYHPGPGTNGLQPLLSFLVARIDGAPWPVPGASVGSVGAAAFSMRSPVGVWAVRPHAAGLK